MAQIPVTTQRIFGAYNPTTNALVGIQISGETPYQNVANALVTPNYAGVRTATNAATNMVMALGKTTQGDGGGQTYVYNPTDTSSGCVCLGTAAGTVLTVSQILSGTITVGLTLASSVTGLPLATILSFGTGLGGTGTYNLSAPVTQVALATFLLDNNSTILVSADGSRWYIQNTTAVYFTTVNAPSGNPAITLTTPAYSFGNPTDNPSFTFNGSGPLTVNSGNIRGLTTLNFGVAGVNYWQLTANGGLVNTTLPTAGTALTLNNNVGDQLVLASSSSTVQSDWNAPTGQVVNLWLNSNGLASGASALLQMNATNNLRLKNFTAGGTTVLGAGGGEQFEITSAGALQGLGPTAAAFVDMTPDQNTTGFTSTTSGAFATTIAWKWRRIGGMVYLWTDAGSGAQTVSVLNALTLNSLPAAIQPAATRNVMCGTVTSTGGTPGLAMATLSNSANFSINPVYTANAANPTGLNAAGLWNTGGGQINAGMVIVYPL
ncbi:MAG TPA: hypothetical protein VF764_12220 [Steroidobacteraceae bacterium]